MKKISLLLLLSIFFQNCSPYVPVGDINDELVVDFYSGDGLIDIQKLKANTYMNQEEKFSLVEDEVNMLQMMDELTNTEAEYFKELQDYLFELSKVK